jgi:hypothetical protein
MTAHRKPREKARWKRKKPLPNDPISAFLIRSGYVMTLGQEYDGQPLKEPLQYFEHVRDRTLEMAFNILGKRWRRQLVEMGVSGVVMRQACGKKLIMKRQLSARSLREVNLLLVAHCSTIRAVLDEYEKELWINLQMTHDPRIDIVPRQREARYNQSRRTLNSLEAGKPVPEPNLIVRMPARLADERPIPTGEIDMSWLVRDVEEFPDVKPKPPRQA